MSFDIRRASKEDLNRLNEQIRFFKLGVETKVYPILELETPEVEADPQPMGFESPDVQPMEFNFGTL